MADVGRLDRIVRNLTRAIPDPPAPIARPSASFAGLKVGQRVLPAATHRDPVPTFVVFSTDSLGASTRDETNGAIMRIEDRNWKATFSRVRTTRKRKEPS